ncbi:hypothetical protein [Hymenobacter montanus]|nr:hypothetical protein [Hymenobacter montanus]
MPVLFESAAADTKVQATHKNQAVLGIAELKLVQEISQPPRHQEALS